MTNRTPARDRSGALGWRRGSQYRGSRVTPVEGRDLSSRLTPSALPAESGPFPPVEILTLERPLFSASSSSRRLALAASLPLQPELDRSSFFAHSSQKPFAFTAVPEEANA